MTETKVITLDGKEVAVRCSAATPIYYRSWFHGDLLVDFNRLVLRQGVDDTDEVGQELPEGAVELLLKAAYVMARQGNPREKRPFEEWLEQFSLMGLTGDIGKIADVILADDDAREEPKKNTEEPSAV